MTNVTISGNRAGTEGGALQLHLADVSLNHVTVAYNKLESCDVPSCTGGIRSIARWRHDPYGRHGAHQQ